MGDPRNKDPDTKVIRMTEADDARTKEAHKMTKDAITGPNTLLWISIPCTMDLNGSGSTSLASSE